MQGKRRQGLATQLFREQEPDGFAQVLVAQYSVVQEARQRRFLLYLKPRLLADVLPYGLCVYCRLVLLARDGGLMSLSGGR